MSASIDQEHDPTNGGGGAREVLVCWLETHAAGECDTPTMQAGFLEGCRMHADAPWDALALLDQYQRRGKLELTVASTLKREIEKMVFGTPGGAAPRVRSPARVQSVSGPRPPVPGAAKPQELTPEPDEEDEPEDEVEDEDEDVAVAPPLMAQPAPSPRRPTETSLAQSAPPSRAQTGSSVRVLRNRYELLEILGRGADGVVYRALDRNRQHLDEAQRHVAIKLLHNEPPLSAAALVEFQRRAHQAQSLVHPNRVRVLDFDADGAQRFLVMEWIPGQLLSSILERDDQTASAPARARRIIGDIGAALVDAHERGLIVGNCTPRKIIVTPTGEAKLIDVGFASSATPSRQPTLDAEPYAARYASAERIDGEPPVASDDVYSFACIAYELLSHRHPYGGRSGAIARSQRLRPERIGTLSHSAWTTLERGLRWNRSERDVSAAHLAAALTGAGVESHHEAETAIRAMRREPATEPRRRSFQWLWLCVLLASVGAAAWWLLTPSEQAQVRERIDAVEQAAAGKTTSQPPVATAPTDTARALTGGQFIPAQPAATESPVWAATPDAAAPLQQDQQRTDSAERSGLASSPDAGVIGFTKDTYVVRESDVVVRIPVVRMHGTRGEVSFRWWAEGNSAEPGSDFGAIEPTREFIENGQSSTVLHIPLVSDSVREGTEMFTVHIDETGGGARLGELTRATVIIVDDD